MNPKGGLPGTQITITGLIFNNYGIYNSQFIKGNNFPANSIVTIGEDECLVISSQNDTIVCNTSTSQSLGPQIIRVSSFNVQSAGNVYFDFSNFKSPFFCSNKGIVQEPELIQLSPAGGFMGDVITATVAFISITANISTIEMYLGGIALVCF